MARQTQHTLVATQVQALNHLAHDLLLQAAGGDTREAIRLLAALQGCKPNRGTHQVRDLKCAISKARPKRRREDPT